MLSLNELNDFLKSNNSDFELLTHDTPIVSTHDAAKYFDIKKAAPTFVMDTEQGLVAFTVSSGRGKIDFKSMKQNLGFSKLKMASSDVVHRMTGYEIGSIPLIGHHLPCVFDDCLLDYDYIYGGSGDSFHTLKIAPRDIIRLNHVIKRIVKK